MAEKYRPKRSLLPAIGLFFLAPLIAEFLLGNLPIKLLGALVLLAPMYGGGALLIRELARRTGRGWPTIVVLALAYGIVEEAFTTQTLFNPDYLHLHMHLLQPAYIPAFGIGGWWTIFVLTLHTAWSISTPIALVEAAVPDHANTPWLGRVGLSITAVLFAAGLVGNTLVGMHQDHFLASHAQFLGSAVICILLIVLAFVLPKPSAASEASVISKKSRAPNLWLVGILALAAGSAVQAVPSHWNWGAAGAILAIDFGIAAVIFFWSRRTSWTLTHKLALGSGAALAYAWHAFIETPVIGGASLVMVRAGNAIFALGVIAIIAFAAKRVTAWQREQAQPLVTAD